METARLEGQECEVQTRAGASEMEGTPPGGDLPTSESPHRPGFNESGGGVGRVREASGWGMAPEIPEPLRW